MRRFLGVISLALLALLLLSGCATASSTGTRIITGGDFVLHNGESINGSLLVLGGNSTLEHGSRVNGNLNVIGGNTNANGEINGSIWIIGGNVNLGPNSLVRGDVNINGGNVSRVPGTQIAGSVTRNATFEGPLTIPVLTITPAILFGWLILRSLVLGALAAVIVIIWPEPVNRTSRVVVEHGVAAGIVGLAVMLLAPILLLLFAITIIGIPLTIIGIAALIVAMVFGTTAIGIKVGERLNEAIKLKMEPALSAGVGTFLLLIAVGLIDLIPIIGLLATIVVSMLALGAVVLTRFGTRVYSPASNVAAPPALPQGRAA